MKCEEAQLALSESMDERRSVPTDVRAHADGCAVCSGFEAGAWRVRELSRFEVPPPVPDLVGSIMTRVESPPARHVRRLAGPPRMRRPRVLVPVAAALAVGLVAGFVLTAGGLIPRPARTTSALAAEVPRGLLGAARALEGYHATFDITELHWNRSVPRRNFVAELWFRAPESFRVSLRDTTRYPSGQWPRNDEQLVTDGRAWFISGSNPCPRQALPACPEARRIERTVVGRPPFDPSTILPTDVIVPMTVLAAQDRVAVTGLDRVGTHNAVRVTLSYQDASPLFQYLRFMGSWRPFFPQDRVELWLDRDTWFPLRYEVFPAAGIERALWASQNGFPKEPSGTPVFVASVRSLDAAQVPPASAFRVETATSDRADEGFRDTRVLAPLGPVPPWTAGLSLWRSGSFGRSGSPSFDGSVDAYADGLEWITVTSVRGWAERRAFGVGSLAEPVSLANGVGLYEPASATDPRRIALHTDDGEILVATNLPRAALIRVVGSLPVRGLALPHAWRVQRWAGGTTEIGLTPDQAIAGAGFPVTLPRNVPRGFRASAGLIVRAADAVTVTIVYRRPAAALDGAGLLLTESPVSSGGTMSPPQEAAVEAVEVQPGLVARWSPQRHLLEWVDHDVYRSLSSPALTLSDLLVVARSFRTGPGR